MDFLVSYRKKLILSSIIFLFCSVAGYAQTKPYAAVSGIITDSLTGKPIEFVAVSLQKSKVGSLSDNDGEFRLINDKTTASMLILSAMGYRTKEVPILPGKYYNLKIKLVSDGVQIKEVVVKRTKEKYSKKNNPAVELIKKVIQNKNKNIIDNEDYWRYSEYERIFFALNDFNPNMPVLRSQKYLKNYIDTSRIDGKKILPYTMREYYRDVYQEKSPRNTKKIVLGYNQQGIDKKMDNRGFSAATDETFKTINIRDNQINLFLIGFVSPLSSSSSVNFYRWYIRDTVQIENKKYIQLGFLPFNTRDLGFSGDLYVADDSTYAVKKVLLRIPKKANINFVKTMLVEQEFNQLPSGLWVPSKFTTMVNFEYEKIGKLYVEKDQSFTNFTSGVNYKQVFETSSDPEIKIKNYDAQDKSFWVENRPKTGVKDLRLDSMYTEATKSKTVRFTLKVADFLQSGYIHAVWDPKINKYDFGSAQTFYSSNSLEGTRLRMGALTTANFNHNLFLNTYAAYGFTDKVWKYYGEATWTFKKRELIKDEFPYRNLTLSYKYDVNTLGQRYLQATRDNFLQSFKVHDVDNMTYKRTLELKYNHETQKGWSALIFALKSEENPGGNLLFNYSDGTQLPGLKTTEAGFTLRYAHNEKFVLTKRRRIPIPTESTIVTLENTWGFDNVLGGDYSYHVTGLGIEEAKWVPPFGKLFLSAKAEKAWGTVPYPLLLMPNANNSYTIQYQSFNLINPLEFINDQQLTWMIDYYMGGWILNRIPLVRTLKWREVFGFRGLLGKLSDHNNPEYNNSLINLPTSTHLMGSTPYMEVNVGIDNIFKFFRVDYVRRLNYLNQPKISKDGFRFGFTVQF